jgi:hypothetical protein
VIRKTVPSLWKFVGNDATTRQRFYDYFRLASHGYAIEVRNPVRFLQPVCARVLSGGLGNLIPPQSYIFLEPGDPLHSILDEQRDRALQESPPPVFLRRIRARHRTIYQKLVARHIAPSYADIDETFAASILRIHDLGYDPAGCFTTRKDVLEVSDQRKRTIGFTTLTFKSGGCVKTGPTILFARFRSKGLGLATRRAIEQRVRPLGVRKLYCTCPEKAERVVRHLLASGMRIEAHLERHYAPTHNELVFGKLLVADEVLAFQPHTPPDLPARVAAPHHFKRVTLVSDFKRLFDSTWSIVPYSFAKAIVRQAVDHPKTHHSQKPKRLVCLCRGRHCIAAILLAPKRGGAVKGVFLRGTRHQQSLRSLLGEAHALARRLHGRKLYFLHPALDPVVLSTLRTSGFQSEGLIRAPYRPGQDVAVLSKFL